MRNLDRFQHYHNRRENWKPPWIKLYHSLMSDYDVLQLVPEERFGLICLWLEASQHGNLLPWDEEWLSMVTHSNIRLEVYEAAGFLEEVQSASSTRRGEERRGEEKESIINKEVDAPEFDPKKFLFDAGVELLKRHQHSDHRARSIIGKWLQMSKLEDVVAAVVGCLEDEKAEPIAYITARLQERATPWDRERDAANARIDAALGGME
jgi:hypothetical protein